MRLSWLKSECESDESWEQVRFPPQCSGSGERGVGQG